jgi:subtilisin family serine protease
VLWLLVLTSLTSAQSSEQRTQAVGSRGRDLEYRRQDDRWLRVEPAGTFEVDSEVVSVRFAPGVADLAAFRERVGADFEPLDLVRSNRLGIVDLRVREGSDVLAVVAALRATGLVEYAEENTLGRWISDPNDALYSDQWSLKNTGQTGGSFDADIDADLAWDLGGGLPSVVVGILDSGTEISHEDLTDNVWINPGEIPNNGVDDEGNGFIDDVYGWDFGNGNNSVPGPFWHGTSVAGVVGATTNNGMGVAGVAGGFGNGDGCRLMILGVGDSAPSGAILDDAILYAADNGGAVITMSLTVGQSNSIDNALDYAWDTVGVFTDCAAGNSGGSVGYPARHDKVVSVPATDDQDDRPSWSSQGPENWIAAPGVDIRMPTTGNGYHYSSGTSFAAPHVAGVAALLLSALPALDNDSLKEILKLTADDVGNPGFDNQTGWGRLNAHAAVQHALDNDCNQNGVYDPDDIANGTSADANANGIPDECECTAPSNFCVSAPNTAGAGALITSMGSQSVAVNDVTLAATDCPPGQPGVFYYGPNTTQIPFGNGFRCVTGTTHRLPVVYIDGIGVARFDFDLTTAPNPGGIQPGDLWHFQYWYRDPLSGGPSTFNLSDGRTIPFCF